MIRRSDGVPTKPHIYRLGDLWVCGGGKNGGVGWSPAQAYWEWYKSMRPKTKMRLENNVGNSICHALAKLLGQIER